MSLIFSNELQVRMTIAGESKLCR